MADGGGKRKKSKREDPGVLSSLPATRPSRLSRRAASDADAPSATKAQSAAAKAKPAGASKPAKKSASAKPKAATGAAAKDAARTAGTKAKAPAKAKAAPALPAPAPPAPTPLAADKPRPVRAASPELAEPIEKAAEQRPEREPAGNPVEQFVRTATGVVKGVLSRLPRP